MFPQEELERTSNSPSPECRPVAGSPRRAPRPILALGACRLLIEQQMLEGRDVLFQVVDAVEKLVRAFDRAQATVLTEDTQYPVQVLALAVQLFPESTQLEVLHASPLACSKCTPIAGSGLVC